MVMEYLMYIMHGKVYLWKKKIKILCKHKKIKIFNFGSIVNRELMKL